ncbi:MAG: hypothetical protein K6E58_01790 [Eubacterium sp.]|nr:hypothetical protein [Eubacterium sp.]
MKKSIKLLSLILVFTFAFSTYAFADDPIDINSDVIRKDMTNFVKTMYYEPRDRVNNISFYNGDYRLDSIKDYKVEYENNREPGTAKITYTGRGNYTGTYTTTFTIAKKPMANLTTKASFNSKKVLTVSANNGSEDLKLGTDFTYTAVTDVDGNVTVTFKGIGTRYTGTCKKTIKAKNNPNPSARSYLKNIVITSRKNIKGKKIKVKWKKIKNIAGYQLRYSRKSSFASAKKLTLANTVKSYTTGKLKKKKTYYLKMRCYIVYNNKKYYGNWTKVSKIKIKK